MPADIDIIGSSGPLRSVTGVAALTASTDASYPFQAPVSHVLIQNNTLTDVKVEFDAAATAGSLTVAPGQLLLFDAPCSVVHLLSTATSSVNGTAANNIVVKGWA